MNRSIRIEVGSAARAAEQSRAAEAEERGEHKSTAEVRMRAATGMKFELPSGPASGPGEALPVQPSPAGASAQAAVPAQTPGPSLGARLADAWRALFGWGSKR